MLKYFLIKSSKFTQFDYAIDVKTSRNGQDGKNS